MLVTVTPKYLVITLYSLLVLTLERYCTYPFERVLLILGRGAQRFVRETIGRMRKAGASGPITLRADSGFFSKYVIQACRDHSISYSITARQTPSVIRAIDSIAESTWIPIDYTENGQAWASETTYSD